jgi:dihydrofolate reductase
MRSLIVSEFVTLDGVMEAPGGETTHPHTNWVTEFPGEEQFDFKYEEIVASETLLVGRVTYESFAGAWPTYEGPFADKMNSMEKVVVSSTLSDLEWANSRVLDGDVVSGVAALKRGDGGPIMVHGSCTLVHTLLEHDLVDELRLMVFPISIGSGLRVFPDARHKVRWATVSSRSFANGVRLDIYRPA